MTTSSTITQVGEAAAWLIDMDGVLVREEHPIDGAGRFLGRLRERGTIDIEYRERDVSVHGRVAPSLAGELESAAGRWSDAFDGDDGADGNGTDPSVPRRSAAGRRTAG